MEPLDICNIIAQWAQAAGVTTPGGKGAIAAAKSDLLGRLVYGGELGPSMTPCPVHAGKWSGLDMEQPGSLSFTERHQAMWDAGCRCATHIGSGWTTGWNPDRNCCLAGGEPVWAADAGGAATEEPPARRPRWDRGLETSRYAPLHDFLAASGAEVVAAAFAELDRVVGGLPASARTTRQWWGNETGQGHVQSRAWAAAGYRVDEVSLDGERVVFRRLDGPRP